MTVNRNPSLHAGRVICLANQKGGVGKTTTAINLATGLAAAGHSALIVDLDPQGNASTGMGLSAGGRAVSSYDVLIGQAEITDAIVPTDVANLSIVPSTVELAGAEIELISLPRRQTRLRHALGKVRAHYDYVLIDCPPSLGLLTVNALVAADAVLVPLQCEFFALEGLSQLIHTVERVSEAFNPQLDIMGIVLTMYDVRNNLSGQVETDVRSVLGEKVYETIIPRNVRVSEATSHGKPAILYDGRCAGSQAYIRLTSELLYRDGQVGVSGHAP